MFQCHVNGFTILRGHILCAHTHIIHHPSHTDLHNNFRNFRNNFMPYKNIHLLLTYCHRINMNNIIDILYALQLIAYKNIHFCIACILNCNKIYPIKRIEFLLPNNTLINGSITQSEASEDDFLSVIL